MRGQESSHSPSPSPESREVTFSRGGLWWTTSTAHSLGPTAHSGTRWSEGSIKIKEVSQPSTVQLVAYVSG